MSDDGKVKYSIRADSSQVDSDMNAAEAKINTAANKIDAGMKKAGIAIGLALAAAGTASIKFGMAFEDSIAMVSTLFGDVNVDSDNLGDKMLALSDKTGIAADQLGGSLYEALSAGVPVTEDMGTALDFLDKSATLARGSGADLTSVVDTQTSVMNAYKMKSEELDKVQKVLMQTQNLGKTTIQELGASLANVIPTASAMGVSFEQVGASMAVMTAQGTPTAQATTQLNQLFAELGKSGTTASDNLKAAAEGTKYAGMSFQDMMAAGVPLNEVLGIMDDYAKKNNLSMIDMFSSIDAGKAALSMSGQNAESYTKALASMSTEQDIVSEAAKKNETTSFKFKQALNELKNMAIKFYQDAIKPMVIGLVDLFHWLSENEPVLIILASIIGGIIGFIVLYNVVAGIMSAVNFILALSEAAVLWPILLIIAGIALVIAAFLIWKKHGQEICDWFVEAFGAIKQFFIDLWTSISDFFIEAWEGIKAFFQPVVDWFSEKIGNIVSFFQKIIDFFKHVFKGDWKAAWEDIKAIFSQIWDGIKEAFKKPINWIIDGINKFTGGLNTIKVPDWVPLVGGNSFNIGAIPRLKVGMDYVPGVMPAILDPGEAVLTAQDAAIWRGLGGSNLLGNISSLLNMPDSSRLTVINIEQTTAALVDLDGNKIGNIILPKITRKIKDGGGNV